MSRAYWPSIQQVVGGELPTTAQIAKTDGQMAATPRRIRRQLFSANELAGKSRNFNAVTILNDPLWTSPNRELRGRVSRHTTGL